MLLKVENITKSYGKRKVLTGVNLELQPGTLSGIVGENGSGKSTLLKIIVGELKPNGGDISVNGKVGYCPQKALLFSQLTVEEHFRYFAAAYGIEKNDLINRQSELMEHFNFEKYKNEKVENLSGGTQQKLNLSIALLHRPDLLILDEPYNGFDWETYLRFWDYTIELQKQNCAIVVVTHFLNEQEKFDRVYNLKKGKLI
jgi:ABC-type multidrug transport system ATPase subunit